MQAATGVGPPGGGREPPREGDGFTFEHLAAKNQLWIDFCADTGDGGCANTASSVSLPHMNQNPLHTIMQKHPHVEWDGTRHSASLV